MAADVIPLFSSKPSSYPVVRPRAVLPHPDKLICMVAWDTETSSLYTDDGSRVATMSVSYKSSDAPSVIQAYAFPFDQGRAADKGFEFQRYAPRTKKAKEAGELGELKADVDLTEWTADVNLSRDDWDDLLRWLAKAGYNVGLIAHNAPFDLHHTRVGTRHWPGVDLEQFLAYDTMLAAARLDPLESVALKASLIRLWGEAAGAEAAELRTALATSKKLHGLRAADGPRYDLLPWSIIGPYAAQDARGTLRLADHQTDRFADGEGRVSDLESAVDLARVTYRMERRGFGDLDVETATIWARRFADRISQLEASLPFSPPTAFRAKEYYFDELGLKPWKSGEEPRQVVIDRGRNKDGTDRKRVIKQGTLTVDVAARLAAEGVPGAAELGEMTRLKTANQMHYQGYLDLAGSDRRIRTDFKHAWVTSGRMSVGRFQAQAIPRRDSVQIELEGYGHAPHPRDLFLVRDGYRRVQLDLSQAELRVAAKFFGCQRHIELLESGGDVHGDATTAIFKVRPGDPKWKYYRTIAKRATFGGLFGIGPRTYQETLWKLAGLDVPFAECSRVIAAFRREYPEYMRAYHDYADFVTEHGFVELVDGSRSWFRPDDWPRSASNRFVQGSLALFNAAWLVEIERRTEDYEALVLSVHDSAVLELPEETVEEVVPPLMARTAEMFEEWFGIVGHTDRDDEW